jgi:NAD(P)-dependent dehydrogenase (short-subunit alcohol dehydrogenase family)
MDKRIGGAVVSLGTVLLGAAGLRRLRPYELSGKVVVITGGSRGLGLVLAREFASRGARVAICARDAAELARARVQLADRGFDVLSYPCDIRDRDSVEDFVQLVTAQLGPVDVVVNNAGVIQAGPLEEMTLEDFQEAIDTYFWGPLHLVLSVLPQMRQRKTGRIVNISSIGGKLGVPHLLPYSAGKFALTGLSEGLRAELMREGIVVTTVCPGLMRTGSPVQAMFKGQRPQEYAWFAISDSLPLASIDAGRAAHQIIDACRHGDAELVITVQAKMAILARTAVPELFSDAMTLLNRLLPGPAPVGGDQARPGRDSESEWAGPGTLLAAPTYDAARENNEL